MDPPVEDPSYIEEEERENLVVALFFLSKLSIKESRPASLKFILSPSNIIP